MPSINSLYQTRQKRRLTKKPIKYLKRDLKVIDFRECNALKPWVDITFLDNNKTYTELLDRINLKQLKN